MRGSSNSCFVALVVVASVLTVAMWSVPVAAAKVKPAVPCTDPRGCPDLIVFDDYLHQVQVVHRTFTPADCDVIEFGQPVGDRVLLAFWSVTPNVGAGDLVIGAVADHPKWFTFSSCHDHYHFKEYADYRLWTPEGYEAWTALRAANPNGIPRDLLAAYPDIASQMVAGRKMGFCVIDLGIYPFADFEPDPGKYGDCLTDQGLSRGWMDAYPIGVAGQYIDVTDVAPGHYVLEDEVNAERFFEESDYANNAEAVVVGVP